MSDQRRHWGPASGTPGVPSQSIAAAALAAAALSNSRPERKPRKGEALIKDTGYISITVPKFVGWAVGRGLMVWLWTAVVGPEFGVHAAWWAWLLLLAAVDSSRPFHVLETIKKRRP